MDIKERGNDREMGTKCIMSAVIIVLYQILFTWSNKGG